MQKKWGGAAVNQSCEVTILRDRPHPPVTGTDELPRHMRNKIVKSI